MVPVSPGDAGALLKELRNRDIRLNVDGSRLRVDAASGALTPALRARVVRHKQQLLELVGAMDEAARVPGIVPLEARGKGVPVFALGGHNGDVFCYRGLVRHLAGERPFYGLQPPGVLGDATPLADIDALARYFADRITEFHRGGACIVAGYCAGGAVAHRVARELAARGLPVSVLVLIAAPFPDWFRPPSQRLQRAAQKVRTLRSVSVLLGRTSPLAWRSALSARIAARNARLASERQREALADGDPVMRLRRAVERATLKAVRGYAPAQYTGRACTIVPSRSWMQLGGPARRWPRALPQLEVIAGPAGSEGDTLLLEPHAREAALLFSRALAATTSGSAAAADRPAAG